MVFLDKENSIPFSRKENVFHHRNAIQNVHKIATKFIEIAVTVFLFRRT
jgi:hypothetical protein